MTVRGKQGKFETITVEPKEKVMQDYPIPLHLNGVHVADVGRWVVNIESSFDEIKTGTFRADVVNINMDALYAESEGEEAGRNRYRIVETKDQEGRSWYHAEEAYDGENWHVVKDITKCDDPLLVEERLRNYSHHRIVKELTL